MRRIFAKWLLLYIAVTFAAALAAAYYMQSKQALEHAVNTISLRIRDAKVQVVQNRIDLDNITDDLEDISKAKAVKLAAILRQRPELMQPGANSESLHELKQLIVVDEINIVDGNGIIVASTEVKYLGFNMDIGEQSRAFNDSLLYGGHRTFVQPITATAYNAGRKMQYAGCVLQDQPGYVQVGYVPERLVSASQVADIKNLAYGFRLGIHGKIIVCEDNKIVSINDEAQLGKELEEYGISLDGRLPGEVIRTTVDGQKVLAIYNNADTYKLIGMLPEQEIFAARNSSLKELLALNLIIFGALFALISWLLKSVVITGIQEIISALRRIAKGDLSAQVNVRTNKEFISLSDDINGMVEALRRAFAESRARIEQELNLAKTIQVSSLPNISAMKRWPTVELSAAMYTAREVGGDFYDFFALDDEHIAFIIADVSGKGIGAAMFMMKAKALLKQHIQSGECLSRAVGLANDELCENNDAFMFVTVFAAILNVRNNMLTVVNAGHNPPLLGIQGRYEHLKTQKNIVLGNFEHYKYREDLVQLSPGDILYCYTDGVTEAFDSRGELYGEQRLLANLNALGCEGHSEFVNASIKQSIDEFAAGTEQADDITTLVIKIVGGASCTSES